MAEHSPAPWFYDSGRCAICYRLPEGHPERYDDDDDGVRNVVCLMGAMGGTDTIADRFVLLAGPAMLAALRAVRDDFGADYQGPTMDAVRAAITLAEGAIFSATESVDAQTR